MFTDGSDYIPQQNVPLEFTSNTRKYCQNILIMPDQLSEANETFNVMLTSNDSSVVFVNNISTITIIDDDSKT